MGHTLLRFWHSCKKGGRGKKYFIFAIFCGPHFCIGHDAKKFCFFFCGQQHFVLGIKYFCKSLRFVGISNHRHTPSAASSLLSEVLGSAMLPYLIPVSMFWSACSVPLGVPEGRSVGQPRLFHKHPCLCLQASHSLHIPGPQPMMFRYRASTAHLSPLGAGVAGPFLHLRLCPQLLPGPVSMDFSQRTRLTCQAMA